MGAQINFWMTAEDEGTFIDRLLQDEVVWTERALELGGRPVARELSEWIPRAEEQWIMLIRRADWHRLVVRDIAITPMPQMTHRVFKPWTMVGGDDSPAFQWRTCVRTNGVIKRGRIYYETDWFDGKYTHRKPPDAGKWFNRLVGWIRRNSEKDADGQHYVLPGASSKVKSGEVRLMPG
jgi:hypothetical protein